MSTLATNLAHAMELVEQLEAEMDEAGDSTTVTELYETLDKALAEAQDQARKPIDEQMHMAPASSLTDRERMRRGDLLIRAWAAQSTERRMREEGRFSLHDR